MRSWSRASRAHVPVGRSTQESRTVPMTATDREAARPADRRGRRASRSASCPPRTGQADIAPWV